MGTQSLYLFLSLITTIINSQDLNIRSGLAALLEGPSGFSCPSQPIDGPMGREKIKTYFVSLTTERVFFSLPIRLSISCDGGPQRAKDHPSPSREGANPLP